MSRTVLVTGAAGGIGGAIARWFLDDGASVVLSDRDGERCAAVADALPARDRVDVLAADLADPEAARARVRAAWARTGPPDVLVNAAGLYPSRTLLDMDDAEWRRVLAVNLDGPFALATEFGRALAAEGRPGCIVNVTSGAGERARRGAAHYCTSKAGLTMLTKALALEFAEHRIRVNAVSPGFIDVASEVNPLRPEYVRAIEAGRPLPRPGTPADVASAVGYLCSDAAGWITGSTLTVDGGVGAGSAALPMS
ncbi:NAD(P)-dependent dehydrogenase (short-subunit alcohol dehydrogenase family) [Murinocardiopsis flavida]|uniref:NAD(P)-dependent dehydrogenase (Short-subunit alcohol dehydrogenase family) n=1 Tax=Murinocardiopsis flavida TaxID=645275 RepID=A0A2P8CZ16_9ACTN|nr:SDR family NAD(P)-dependent oxidoreductase [Murinocardiopsis flavida]PSK90222.1 NAD(P)-dependent dehydrogenase (short-subunit alcohol dehydrogenase family) [Murinocardiopsis flavida]